MNANDEQQREADGKFGSGGGSAAPATVERDSASWAGHDTPEHKARSLSDEMIHLIRENISTNDHSPKGIRGELLRQAAEASVSPGLVLRTFMRGLSSHAGVSDHHKRQILETMGKEAAAPDLLRSATPAKSKPTPSVLVAKDACMARVDRLRLALDSVRALPVAERVRLGAKLRLAKDADPGGKWEEGKHPRSDNGQFGTGGAAGGSAQHHATQAKAHSAEAQKLAGKGHPDYTAHAGAAEHHEKAALHLEEAAEYGRNAGRGAQAQESLKEAQKHADFAAKHEAALAPKAEVPSASPDDLTAKAKAMSSSAKTKDEHMAARDAHYAAARAQGAANNNLDAKYHLRMASAHRRQADTAPATAPAPKSPKDATPAAAAASKGQSASDKKLLSDPALRKLVSIPHHGAELTPLSAPSVATGAKALFAAKPEITKSQAEKAAADHAAAAKRARAQTPASLPQVHAHEKMAENYSALAKMFGNSAVPEEQRAAAEAQMSSQRWRS